MTFRELQFERDKFQGDKIESYWVFLGNVKYKWTDINRSRHVYVCTGLSIYTQGKQIFWVLLGQAYVTFGLMVSAINFYLFLMFLFWRIFLCNKETFLIEVSCWIRSCLFHLFTFPLKINEKHQNHSFGYLYIRIISTVSLLLTIWRLTTTIWVVPHS